MTTDFTQALEIIGLILVLTVLVETYLWYNLLHRRSTAIA
ncbi:hypothetical protein CWATWH0402_4792 [Crocosphaera watsonii WH 0402]|uniref:Uncharacterized protein n=1 Tax=Crocosphaera watsonii WH 0402 TaxID=1284629 RepID=T2JYK7_CROWT|nr:hypothetical protein CWATWH0402_4792 [Crocosphaera watsonii WH 0402]